MRTIGVMPDTGYVFDTAERAERDRLEVQARAWDRFTIRTLDDVGVTDGWRCLEVAGGTGTVASWLSQRVGARGHVTATDLETKWLDALTATNLEVRRHDVVNESFDERYDLVHTRLLLMHLPERDAVIAKLAAALKPGGWLVVEDFDVHSVTVSDPPDALWTKLTTGLLAAHEAAGVDAACGRKLAGALRAAGLAEVEAEGAVLMLRTPELSPLLVPVLERLRYLMLESGHVSSDEIDSAIDGLADDRSNRWVCSPTMISARGRRS
jgi:SAM-dependent methyltransferase